MLECLVDNNIDGNLKRKFKKKIYHARKTTRWHFSAQTGCFLVRQKMLQLNIIDYKAIKTSIFMTNLKNG